MPGLRTHRARRLRLFPTWKSWAALVVALASSTVVFAQETPKPAPLDTPPQDSRTPREEDSRAPFEGEAKSGVVRPPADIDPSMSKRAPEVDPGMQKAPPGTKKAPNPEPPPPVAPKAPGEKPSKKPDSPQNPDNQPR